MKRQGGRRDSDGLPTSFTSVSERERQLENQVQQLKQQLHEQEIQNLLDLRQALGLVGERERSQSAENLARIPIAALRLLKTDLVKVLAKINGLTLPSPTSTETIRGDEPYIA
jgi:hypothetical protein